MALIETLIIDANESVQISTKNGRNGILPRYTFVAFGDFSSGTLTVGVSADGGTTVVTDIADTALTFTADASRNLDICSTENDPIVIDFTMTGASTPDVTIKVYNTK